MFWIRKRPFSSRKAPKSAPHFFFKKRHNFGQRRHNLRLFLLGMKLKMTHHKIFIVFLGDNFSQSNENLQNHSNSNIFPRKPDFFTRPKIFFAPQGSPKAPLWRLSATFRNTVFVVEWWRIRKDVDQFFSGWSFTFFQKSKCFLLPWPRDFFKIIFIRSKLGSWFYLCLKHKMHQLICLCLSALFLKEISTT